MVLIYMYVMCMCVHVSLHALTALFAYTTASCVSFVITNIHKVCNTSAPQSLLECVVSIYISHYFRDTPSAQSISPTSYLIMTWKFIPYCYISIGCRPCSIWLLSQLFLGVLFWRCKAVTCRSFGFTMTFQCDSFRGNNTDKELFDKQ